jgi:transcriptional regulator with XRE-family HTH domain
MSYKLVHYLRNERRRLALTQGDIAALIGVRWKQRVSRYERGALPPLKTAMAYEAIAGKPVADLFGGTYQDIAVNVRNRAHDLLRKIPEAHTPRELRRKESLEHIAA